MGLDLFIRSQFLKFFNLVEQTGEYFLFFWNSLLKIFKAPFRFEEILKHVEFIGIRSLGIIILTGGFTGLALTLQIWLGFSLVGAPNLVGPTVALGIFRELGPVLTGLIVSARAGGAMAARLGTMKVTEQIEALKVMGVNPIQYLVAPRVLASVLVAPILCGVFDFMAMGSSYFLSVSVLDMDGAIFLDKIFRWIKPSDIYEGLIKASVFGLIFSTICTYKGYHTKGGAKGVGEATNSGVVLSMVFIIIFDYVLTNVIRVYFWFVS